MFGHASHISTENDISVVIYSLSSYSSFFLLLHTKEGILKNVGNRNSWW